ncbi:MAG: 3-deoxy-manno-octulosonate cytidylyltransferase [Verrucomicrobiota bacterium]|jgi:3-deoxy-manno-octulosonate cytidylyltransferase (CMP-KDO synthetase)
MPKGGTVLVIPARYASTRFPGKPLALIAGRPMIQWVHEAACRSKLADLVIVATDDIRIKDLVEGFGGRVAMTSPDHPSGTDRIAEAVKDLPHDLVINLQGDEPLLPPEVVDQLIEAMRADPAAAMGTVAVPCDADSEDFRNPNIVKVVTDASGRALYFSRSPIPYLRNKPAGVKGLTHWGIYAYRRQLLDDFVKWPQGRLEAIESLEQLRALENGVGIRVLISDKRSIGVDVPDDVAKVEAQLRVKS